MMNFRLAPVAAVSLWLSLLCSSHTSAQWVQTGTIDGAGVHTLIVSGTNLFAGMTTGGVFLSTDQGNHWTAVNEGLTSPSVTCLALNGENILAGTWGEGVFRSSNNGSTWTPANGGQAPTYINSLFSNQGRAFAGAGPVGIYFTDDCGTTWSAVNSIPPGLGVVSFIPKDANLFAGTFSGAVLLSTDSGMNWTKVNADPASLNVSCFAVIGTDLFAGTSDNGVYLSTDDGIHWTNVSSGFTGEYTVNALVANGMNLFAGAAGGAFVSSNNGTLWKAINDGLPETKNTWSLAVCGPVLYAGLGGSAGVFQRAFDEILPIGLTSFTVSVVDGSSATLRWSTASEVNNYGFTIQSKRAHDRDFVDVAGTFVAGHGTTVAPHSYSLTILCAVEPQMSFRLEQIDLDGTVHMSEPVMLSGSTLADVTPLEFALNQNYPNPFNPTTIIRYSLPRKSEVVLTVYNTLGQEVATLVQGQREAGAYEAKFDGSGLASGVYLYRLHAGDFTQTKRSFLLR